LRLDLRPETIEAANSCLDSCSAAAELLHAVYMLTGTMTGGSHSGFRHPGHFSSSAVLIHGDKRDRFEANRRQAKSLIPRNRHLLPLTSFPSFHHGFRRVNKGGSDAQGAREGGQTQTKHNKQTDKQDAGKGTSTKLLRVSTRLSGQPMERARTRSSTFLSFCTYLPFPLSSFLPQNGEKKREEKR